MNAPVHAKLASQLPFYQPVADECTVFETAWRQQLPVLIKGPTGCGKTRFVEHMAWRLGRPLITVSCHDDLTASDLIGRFHIRHDGTQWQDGPLTRAVREGAICYLDEVVEARQDTVVLVHPLTDYRRVLPIDKTGELIEAAPGFQLVVSYNPGYQRMLKDLKPSTRQRFVALDATASCSGSFLSIGSNAPGSRGVSFTTSSGTAPGGGTSRASTCSATMNSAGFASSRDSDNCTRRGRERRGMPPQPTSAADKTRQVKNRFMGLDRVC